MMEATPRHITRKYYTGRFCNEEGNYSGSIPFEEHPQNLLDCNPEYPYLEQFLKNISGTQICLGISLWEIEMTPEFCQSLQVNDVHALITSPVLLQFQLWNNNGITGPVDEIQAPLRTELQALFAQLLFEMQVHGNNRVLLEMETCQRLAAEFLDHLEMDGKLRRAFYIRYGWADWFALDSHYDFGFLLVADSICWLMTFSESD